MSEKVTIKPQYTEDFLEWLGIVAYHEHGGEGSEKPWPKMKRKEQQALQGTVILVRESISKGLILAKSQPELADAHIQYLNAVRPGYADELLNGMLDTYREFLYFKLSEKGWSPPGAPK